MPIRIKQSSVHGRGVFATRDIAPGERVGVYAGRRHAPGEFPLVDAGIEFTQIFALSDGSCIDGSVRGNVTAHLNHSCGPNCEAIEEWGAGGRLQIVFVALGEIRRGAEVFIDYALQTELDDAGEYACRCASALCRGSMTAAPAG